MLSEPLSVTYNGSSKSLNRIAYGDNRGLTKSQFVTTDGEFLIQISETPKGDLSRIEITLTRTERDADGDPFTGNWSALPNTFGLVFETNHLNYNTSVDIPLLQAALTSLVDSTVRSRLLAGEK